MNNMDSDKLLRLFRSSFNTDSDAFHQVALDIIEDEKRKKL